jgi:hypothetical protein
MTALLPILFVAAAILALSSMFATARRYAGAVLALGEPTAPRPRPRNRRSIASRSRVRTPRRAAMRGKRLLGNGQNQSPIRIGV